MLDIVELKLIDILYPDNIEVLEFFVTNHGEIILSNLGNIFILDKNGLAQKKIQADINFYLGTVTYWNLRQLIVSSLEGNQIHIIDTLDNKSSILTHYTELNARFLVTKDEQHLVTSTKDGIVYIWDISSIQNPFVKSRFKTNGLWHCNPQEFIVNETLLLVRTISNYQIWDWKKPKLVLTFVLLRGESAIAYTPDGFYEIFDEEALNYFDFRSKDYESGFLPEEEKLKFHKPGLLRSIYEEYSQN